MMNYKGRAMRTSCVGRLLAVAGGLLTVLQPALGDAEEKPPPVNETGAVLKVISVRKMSPEEYLRRVDDNIGAEFSVRLRLEASATRGVYFFAPGYGEPFTYALERRGTRIRWLAAPRGEDETKSPGFERLRAGITPAWILLPPGAAYEWEGEIHRTPPGTEESRCIFVKRGMKGKPVELISPWYSTPEPGTGQPE